MADGVAITPGSGKDIHTDERSINAATRHVQWVALSLGPKGSHTAALSGRVVTGGDGAVNVDARPKMVRLAQSPTVSTSAYATKDAVGGLLTFASAARYSGGSVRLESVQILDKGEGMGAVDLFLFDRTFTAPTDNAAFTPTDAELATCVCVVRFAAATEEYPATGNDVWHKQVGTSFPLNGTDLFGVLVARGAMTLVSTADLTVTLNLYQD